MRPTMFFVDATRQIHLKSYRIFYSVEHETWTCTLYVHTHNKSFNFYSISFRKLIFRVLSSLLIYLFSNLVKNSHIRKSFILVVIRTILRLCFTTFTNDEGNVNFLKWYLLFYTFSKLITYTSAMNIDIRLFSVLIGPTTLPTTGLFKISIMFHIYKIENSLSLSFFTFITFWLYDIGFKAVSNEMLLTALRNFTSFGMYCSQRQVHFFGGMGCLWINLLHKNH